MDTILNIAMIVIEAVWVLFGPTMFRTESDEMAGGRSSALRSKFGTKAKKKSASGVPGDKKALVGAAQTAEVADKNTLFKWVTCPQCKKTRK